MVFIREKIPGLVRDGAWPGSEGDDDAGSALDAVHADSDVGEAAIDDGESMTRTLGDRVEGRVAG